MKHKRFDDIEHTPLRVYNRLVVAMNLTEDFGKEVAAEYIESFAEGERVQISLMANYLDKFGADSTRKFATQGLVLPDEGEVLHG